MQSTVRWDERKQLPRWYERECWPYKADREERVAIELVDDGTAAPQ
jgi:hypothetical protein